jgi:hypothetical protein
MTLYRNTLDNSLDLEEPHLHALLIGVGDYPNFTDNSKHPTFDLKRITTTSRAALNIAKWLANNYNNPNCPLGSIELLLSPTTEIALTHGRSITIEVPTLTNVREAYNRWRGRCDSSQKNIALFYFAGHGISTSSHTQFLLLDDFADPKNYDLWTNCIDFKAMRDGLKGCAAATQLYFIDACRNVPIEAMIQLNPHGQHLGAADVYKKAISYTYYASSAGNKAYGIDGGPTFFSQALLTSLGGVGTSGRVVTTSSLATSLATTLLDLGGSSAFEDDGGVAAELHFPKARTGSDGHALEEALGYATQAFRDYLNQHVLKNVELIYFLSYDVWDGCLLYDGLVNDSIEQRLLDYIRRTFLHRDRLRSRYEEFVAEKEPLGAAGQCFREALEYSQKNGIPGDEVAIECLWYIGDLSRYHSEYQAFDRLLGLVSCLYIPIIGNLLPTLSGQPSRPPYGGVLMAGNRTPYGLAPLGPPNGVWKPIHDQFLQAVPKDSDVESVWSSDKESVWSSDKEIARAISLRLRDKRFDRDVRQFLACIGGVYAKKASARSELRRLVHPRFAKAVARDLKRLDATQNKTQADAIEQIGERAIKRVPADINWPERFGDDFGQYLAAIKEKIPDDIKRDLVHKYVLAGIWRDLKLTSRLRGKEVSKQEVEDIEHALSEKPPVGPLTGIGLDEYIRAHSQPYAPRSATEDGMPLRTGDTARLRREIVDDLIDDLRELQNGTFEVLVRPLLNLAPTDSYLSGIADVEAVLAASTHQQGHLHQLAHTVQVWMLGAWILEQKLDERETLRDRILRLIYQYFEGGASPLGIGAWLRDRWTERDPQIVDLFWGLIAGTHDIAAPLQSFQDWCREFFIKYFEVRTLASFDLLPALLDVFHHPRFPFYKSAITNHYGSQERNWLESVFHRGLSSRIDHALAGSLILMREIEPDEGYSGEEFWRKLSHPLKKLSQGERPELGLIMPAYISHAVAFSHVSDMRWRWLHAHGLEDSRRRIGRRGFSPEPPYFTTTAEKFSVSCKKFPLTYLIALCEALLDREETAWSAKLKSRLRLRMLSEEGGKITVSPFYIRNVRVAAVARPTIVLSLCLWERELWCERRFVCRSNELSNIAYDFKNTLPLDKEWIVYETEELYRKEKLNVEVEHEGPGWCDIKLRAGGTERRLLRSTYELLMMYLRMEEFPESYVCDDVRFHILFENVENGDGKPMVMSLERRR